MVNLHASFWHELQGPWTCSPKAIWISTSGFPFAKSTEVDWSGITKKIPNFQQIESAFVPVGSEECLSSRWVGGVLHFFWTHLLLVLVFWSCQRSFGCWPPVSVLQRTGHEGDSVKSCRGRTNDDKRSKSSTFVQEDQVAATGVQHFGPNSLHVRWRVSSQLEPSHQWGSSGSCGAWLFHLWRLDMIRHLNQTVASGRWFFSTLQFSTRKSLVNPFASVFSIPMVYVGMFCCVFVCEHRDLGNIIFWDIRRSGLIIVDPIFTMFSRIPEHESTSTTPEAGNGWTDRFGDGSSAYSAKPPKLKWQARSVR